MKSCWITQWWRVWVIVTAACLLNTASVPHGPQNICSPMLKNNTNLLLISTDLKARVLHGGHWGFSSAVFCFFLGFCFRFCLHVLLSWMHQPCLCIWYSYTRLNLNVWCQIMLMFVCVYTCVCVWVELRQVSRSVYKGLMRCDSVVAGIALPCRKHRSHSHGDLTHSSGPDRVFAYVCICGLIVCESVCVLCLGKS